MTNISVRKVVTGEENTLLKISVETFCETFSEVNAEENMSNYLETEFSIEKLKAGLQDKNVAFYFATVDDQIIGYLKLNHAQSQTELKDDKAMEIERIYVLSSYHGKNVGQLLLEKSLEIASQCKVEYVWLGVWEENPRAIQFYRKNGFVAFDKHIFMLGKDPQTDILMKRILKNTTQGQ